MGKLSGRGVLLVWVDLDPALQTDADRWYEQEHFPERITQSGYLRARRFRALSGAPEHMGVLEAETAAALASEGYKRVTANINERSRRMRNAFRRIIRSPHSVLTSIGTLDGAVMLCARIQFADDAERAGFSQWAESSFEPWVQQHAQVLGGHALAGAPNVRRHMDSFRASGQEDESADGVILLEFGRPTDAEAMLPLLSIGGLRSKGLKAQDVVLATYQLMFDVTPRNFPAIAETKLEP
jgi:hypothetical protein